MTNEEIEKRFLFDLEMGRFKCINFNNRGDIFFNRSIFSFKLLTLLKNIGYTIDEDSCDINIDYLKKSLESRETYISVYKKYDNIYDVFEWGYIEDDIKKNNPEYFNKIPDYVKDYKLWLMKKLKRDFYLT